MTDNTDTIRAGLIGYPVEHSLSPLIHNEWIHYYGLRGRYTIHEILPEKLKSAVLHLVEQNYAGFNVTLPYKQDIIALCDTLDETARTIGAVNTVVVKEDGRLHGKNTDAFGFVQNIKETNPDFDLTAGPALVLGAGGAARAVIYALQKEGVPAIRIANRTRGKAEELAQDFTLDIVNWEEREEAAKNANLLVNTTSLGMAGQPNLDLNLQYLPKTSTVYDIVYAPHETDLLRKATTRGNNIVTGIGMLLHQARPAFEAWFGLKPEITEELQKKIREHLQ